MKKILAGLLCVAAIVIASLILCGCGNDETETEEVVLSLKECGTVVRQPGEDLTLYYIPQNKTMFMGCGNLSMTQLFNPDGTPMLYEGKEVIE